MNQISDQAMRIALDHEAMKRIGALPIRAKVLCGAFAYGYTEEPEEPGDPRAPRVGAQTCTAIRRPFGIRTCGSHGPMDQKNMMMFFLGLNILKEYVAFGNKSEEGFAEYVGDKVWRGGIARVDWPSAWMTE